MSDIANAPDPIAAIAERAAQAQHGGAVTTLFADDVKALHAAHVALEARAASAESRLAEIHAAVSDVLAAHDAGAKPSDATLAMLRACAA